MYKLTDNLEVTGYSNLDFAGYSSHLWLRTTRVVGEVNTSTLKYLAIREHVN